jgi:hypothetical protein
VGLMSEHPNTPTSSNSVCPLTTPSSTPPPPPPSPIPHLPPPPPHPPMSFQAGCSIPRFHHGQHPVLLPGRLGHWGPGVDAPVPLSPAALPHGGAHEVETHTAPTSTTRTQSCMRSHTPSPLACCPPRHSPHAACPPRPFPGAMETSHQVALLSCCTHPPLVCWPPPAVALKTAQKPSS